MLRQQTQSVKKTNGRFPEFKGSQRCHRGPRVDSEWSGKPVRFATVCVCIVLGGAPWILKGAVTPPE